jgi:hypothetical protein
MEFLDIISNHPLPILDFRSRKVLIEHLRFLYGIIVASESLLIRALEKESLPHKLRTYYGHHLREERDHADWLREDLAGPEIPPVNWRAAKIAGMQYYLIEHVSPVALLGYMATLECRPMKMAAIEKLEHWHGKSIMRTWRYHAEHDIAHGQDILKLIDTLDPVDKSLVLANAAHTAQMLSERE